MRICDCHIFRILTHFFTYLAKCAYRRFFLHKVAFLTAILIFFVFLLPISIRFHYLDHLVAIRMASSMCPDPCGTIWGCWFQAILYHILAAYLVFIVRIFLKKKCRVELTCLINTFSKQMEIFLHTLL